MERLRPGDVLRLTRGRRAGLAIVLDAGISTRDDPRPLVLTQGRWSGRLSTQDFTVPPEVLGRVRIPARFNHRSAADRRALATQLSSFPSSPRQDASRRSAAEDPQISRLRLALRAHPCHRCPDREEHARWAGRRDRLSRERDSLRTRIEGRTDSLGRAFDRICALLTDRGYLSETGQNGTVRTVGTGSTVGTVGTVTESGRMLARVWSDSDLLVAECLRAGVWEGLDAAELAAVVSCLVYEPRRDEREVTRLPTSAVRQAMNATLRIWADLADDELERGLVRTREPELGFAWPAYRWARQEGLDRVIAATAEVGPVMSAGDFVRWCKQLLDLLSQLSQHTQHSQIEQLGQFDRSETGSNVTRASTVAASARAAIDTIRRGVIAQSMLA
jgi:ATP-dependent RNA helicase HelY